MLNLRFLATSCLLLLLCLCFTASAMASGVEYQFGGTNSVFFVDDSASFDLIAPSFITTDTTETSWISCSYNIAFVGPDTCTQITFTPGFVEGSSTYDALSLSTAGGNGFTDLLFPVGSFGAYGVYGSSGSDQGWFGTLTVSAAGAPEPASFLMLGSGLLSALGWRRRRNRLDPAIQK